MYIFKGFFLWSKVQRLKILLTSISHSGHVSALTIVGKKITRRSFARAMMLVRCFFYWHTFHDTACFWCCFYYANIPSGSLILRELYKTVFSLKRTVFELLVSKWNWFSFSYHWSPSSILQFSRLVIYVNLLLYAAFLRKNFGG